MVGPASFFRYQRFRYLKLALLSLGAVSIAFAVDRPPGGRGGGTPLGYALGGLATALILWLTWFGVRKRRYASRGAPLVGWLSAHVYLGLTLLLLVPLHSAFRFGWNVHTLAYVLMSGVIFSGIVGVILYSWVPTPMTANRPGTKIDALLQRIADVDRETTPLAMRLPDVVSDAVAVSVASTRIGGGFFRRLSGTDPRCPTERAYEVVRAYRGQLTAEQHADFVQLLDALSVKRTLVRKVRTDIRYESLLRLWLPVHIPLSLATIAAVAVHIFVVLYY